MLDRRSFTAGGILGTALIGRPAKAELSCGPFDGNGVRICTAGVKINKILPAQKCKDWCWAACIETIFLLKGKKVSQSRIAKRLFGGTICKTATGPEIVNTINGEWETNDGETFSASAEPLLDLHFGVTNPMAAAMVAQELSAGRPVINGALGHATVLTAMTYYVDVYGRGIPQQIVIRDPWPYNPNRRILNAQEAANTFFIAKVQVDDE
jgi:hypothetical protein